MRGRVGEFFRATDWNLAIVKEEIIVSFDFYRKWGGRFGEKCRFSEKKVEFGWPFCPSRSAGVLNPLTRKIVFVRASVRASVRPCVCTPFPYCDFATFQFFFENLWFWTKTRDFAAHFLFENRWFWMKIREFAAHFLFQNQRFWTKLRDLRLISSENRRFWMKLRDFAAHFLCIWKSTISGRVTSR